ncbi:hypothetical protein D3C84_629890 [compost metagenome]
MLALEAGHDQLVLEAQLATRAEQPGTVAVASIGIAHRQAARLQIDAEPGRDPGAQGPPVLQQRLDTGDGCLQVTALYLRQLPRQHQPGIFRQHQQLRAGHRGLGAEALQVGRIGIPPVMQLDGVLAGGDPDHGVSSLSQKDMGLADSASSSRSRQWYSVRSSGWCR